MGGWSAGRLSLAGPTPDLSAGTVCYGLYANPKSGKQGSVARDGVLEGTDLHPAGAPDVGDTPQEVLASYVCDDAVAHSCAYAGLRLTGPRPVVGPPDIWATLPRRDHWTC